MYTRIISIPLPSRIFQTLQKSKLQHNCVMSDDDIPSIRTLYSIYLPQHNLSLSLSLSLSPDSQETLSNSSSREIKR